MKRVLAEQRQATPEEQALISRYVGWGRSSFSEGLFAYYGSDAKWEKEKEQLKALLTEEEWDAARESTVNAHYTSPRIAAAMWRMAERMGFRGGVINEPATGTGIFFGTMPAALRAKSSLTGSEMDSLTANIAKVLYPSAKIWNSPYQDVTAPDNFFHLGISNYPFADVTIRNDRYNKVSAKLHDYFFLKQIATIRPGGLIIAITSTGTMDKQNSRVREELAKQADLVAAMRIPGGAFQKVAGTEVVTDIIILKKRAEGEAPSEVKWLNLKTLPDPDGGEPIAVNEYFADHPEQILGRLDRKSKLYGKGNMHVGVTADFAERLEASIQRLSPGTYEDRKDKRPTIRQAVEAQSATKNYGYEVKDGKLWQRQGGEMVQIEAGKEKTTRITSLLKIRDAVRDLIGAELQGKTDAVLAPLRSKLNAIYDGYVAKHGAFHDRGHGNLMTDDPDWNTLLALENYNPETKEAKKADVFSKRTVKALERKTKADTLAQAVGISLNETGMIDVIRIAELRGISGEEAEKALLSEGMVYRLPGGGLELKDYYLSGNVREKLIQAQTAAGIDSRFEPNAAALKKVIPEDKPHSEIDIKLGSPWVPAADYQEFFAHLLRARKDDISMTYLAKAGTFVIELTNDRLRGFTTYNETWGTRRADFLKIVKAAIDDKPIMIFDYDSDKNKIYNADESAAANMKVEAVREAFKDWIWSEDERRVRLHRYYNDNFNNIVETQHDGAWLEFPTMDATIIPYKHQLSGIARLMQTRRMLAGHEVGTGKTLLYGMAAAKMKELGYANKPALVVLKSTIEQVTDEIQRAFPTMKILSTNENFDSQGRQKTIARIATGDWDLVIMTHDHMDMMDVDKDVEEGFIREEIKELTDAILASEAQSEESGGGGRRGRGSKQKSKTTKNLEKMRERLEERLQEALDRPRDPATSFQRTGIDMLMVDEAHYYKSLPVYTARGSVKGIPQSRSDRATNLLMNTRWMTSRNPKAVLMFGTGTPIDNSMVELYNWQKYLQSADMVARGIESFDGWANTFGQTTTQVEPDASGNFKAMTRFKRFTNLQELSGLAHIMLDTRFIEDMPNIKRPRKIESIVKAPMSDQQANYMRAIAHRAKALKGKKVEKGGDNMLKICTDGRKAALHMGLVTPDWEEHSEGKIDQGIRNVIANYKADPTKTQMIFLDMGVNPTDWGFHLYKYIQDKLVKGGIPRDKVIDFSSLKDGDERLVGISRLREGRAAVGIGSTPKMGTGVNAQKHLRWLHHFDAPLTPGRLVQRDGRGWRQGNQNEELGVIRYVTEGSLDAFVWSLINNKHGFITQFLKHGTKLREIDEMDSEELSPARVMAEATGNPDVLNAIEAQEQVKKLEQKKRIFEAAQGRIQSSLDFSKSYLRSRQADMAAVQKDVAQEAATANDLLSVEVKGRTYTEMKLPLAKALDDVVMVLTEDTIAREVIAKMRGFTIGARYVAEEGTYGRQTKRLRYTVIGPGGNEYDLTVSNTEGDEKLTMLSLIRSAQGVLRNLPKRVAAMEREIKEAEENAAQLESQLGKKFEGGEELAKQKRIAAEIMGRLQRAGQGHGQDAIQIDISKAEDNLEELEGPEHVNRMKAMSDRLNWSLPNYLEQLRKEIKKSTDLLEKDAEKDTRLALAESAGPGTEIDLTDVAATVADYLGGRLPVTVVESDADLPAGLRAEARGKRVAGAYVGGRIYLVRGNIESTAHAIRVVLEEAAHMGLRKAGVLKDIVNTAYNNRGKYAILHGRLMKQYGFEANEPRLTEEIIAHVAQEGQKDPGLWKRLVAAIVRAFRRIGMFKKLTDAEVEVLAARALQASVERKGTAGAAAGPRMALAAGETVGGAEGRFSLSVEGQEPEPAMTPEQKATYDALVAKLDGIIKASTRKAGAVGPKEDQAEREGSIQTAGKQAAEPGPGGFLTRAHRVGRRLGLIEMREKTIEDAKERYEEISGKPWPGQKAVNIKPVITAAVKAGIEKEKEKGRLMSIEYSVDKAFKAVAKSEGARELDWLGRLARKVKWMDDMLADPRLILRDEFLRREIESTFGQERTLAMVRSSHYWLEGLYSSIKQELHDRLHTHYARAIDKIWRRFQQEGVAPNKWLAQLTPGPKDDMVKLLREIPTRTNDIGVLETSLGKTDFDTLRGWWERAQTALTQSRTERYIVVQGRRLDAKDNAEELAGEVAAHLKNLMNERGVTPRDRGAIKNLMTDYYANSQTAALMAFGEKSTGYEMFYGALAAGDARAKAIERDARVQLEAALKAEKIDDAKRWRMDVERKAVKLGERTVMMTDSERMYFAALWQREEARQKLLRNSWIMQYASGTSHTLQEPTLEDQFVMAQAILKTLTPAENRIVNKIVDIMTAFGPLANHVSRALYGFDKFVDPRYFGMVVENLSAPTDAEMESSSLTAMKVLEGVGFAQATKDHGMPLKIGSIFAQFEEHSKMMSKYIALTIPIRNILNSLRANQTQLTKALNEHAGTKYIGRLKEMLRDLAGLEHYDRNGLRGVFEYLTGNVAKAILGLNPGSYFANRVGGSLLYASELRQYSPAAAADFTATMFMPASKLLSTENRRIADFLQEDGYLWDRWNYDISRVYIPMGAERVGKTPQSILRMRLRWLQQKALAPMKHAEMSNAINAFKALRRHGMTDERARDMVVAMTRASQNSSSALEDAPFIRDVRKSGLGAMFPFLSQTVAARNLVVRDWLRRRFGQMALSVLGLLLGLVGKAMFDAWLRGTGEPDKTLSWREEDRRAAIRTVRLGQQVVDQMVPGLEGMTDLTATISGWLGGPYIPSGTDLLPMRAAEKLKRGIKGLSKGNEPSTKAVLDLFEGAGQLLGLPTGGPVKVLRAATAE